MSLLVRRRCDMACDCLSARQQRCSRRRVLQSPPACWGADVPSNRASFFPAFHALLFHAGTIRGNMDGIAGSRLHLVACLSTRALVRCPSSRSVFDDRAIYASSAWSRSTRCSAPLRPRAPGLERGSRCRATTTGITRSRSRRANALRRHCRIDRLVGTHTCPRGLPPGYALPACWRRRLSAPVLCPAETRLARGRLGSAVRVLPVRSAASRRHLLEVGIAALQRGHDELRQRAGRSRAPQRRRPPPASTPMRHEPAGCARWVACRRTCSASSASLCRLSPGRVSRAMSSRSGLCA